MSDTQGKSDIIGLASGSEDPKYVSDYNLDMSKDLPMQNAIDVVYCSTVEAKEKNQDLIGDSKRFAKALREELLANSMLVEEDNRKASRVFFDAVPTFAHETFMKLKSEMPSYKLLLDEVKLLVGKIAMAMNRSPDWPCDNYSDLADKLMMHVWPQPIQPYIKNVLLRETAISSIDLVGLWHSAIETGDLTREEAVKQLEYCGKKANGVSRLFTNDSNVYFCEDIESTNELDKLQKLWLEEPGDTVVSWEKRHGAFVKASLMYAIHTIDGTICREETGMVMKEIRRRLESVCKDWGGEKVLLNPTDEGKVGPNSLIINKIDYNSKDPESEYLKFITKLLSDDIAPDAHTTSDRHRFRGYMLEDPRQSHPSFANLPVEVAEIATATKYLAIIMMCFGTTVDKRNVRNSINTGQPVNGKSGRKHRALQGKGSIFVDKYANGTLREKAKSYMYEWQVVCNVPEGDYEADIAEYRKKKIANAQNVLGVGVNFAADTLNHCDVFVNRYGFPHDTPEMRELAEATFGSKMLNVPFMKEMVAKKILDRLVSDDPDTKKIICTLMQRRSAGKKISQALVEMESYLGELKRHYLITRSLNLLSIASELVKDDQFIAKIKTFHRHLREGQVIEHEDVNERISSLQNEFEEYASLHGLAEYDEKNYSYIKRLLTQLEFVACQGPSGLDAKLKQAKHMCGRDVKSKSVEEKAYVPSTGFSQLSLFVDDQET